MRARQVFKVKQIFFPDCFPSFIRQGRNFGGLAGALTIDNLRLDMVVGVELETRGGVLGAGRDDGPVEHLVEIGRHQVAVKTERAHFGAARAMLNPILDW